MIKRLWPLLLALLTIPLITAADSTQTTLDPFRISGTTIFPRNSAAVLQIPSQAGSGGCAYYDGSGNLLGGATCSGGSGGGGATTTINGLTPVNGVFNFVSGNGSLVVSTTSPRTITLTVATSSIQNLISLTTTGTSGAATYSGGVLNIPQYQAAGSYVTNSYASTTFPSFTYASSTYYMASNPSGYITSSALSPYLTTASAASTYYLQSNPSNYISLSSLSGTSPITYNSGTGAIGFNGTGYVSNAYASSTFPSFTYASSTYYLATNPSGYISGNQSITWTASNDVSGSASGATSISPALTVTGIQGKAISLASGYLKYNGSAWVFDNSTFLTSPVLATQGGTGTTTAPTVTGQLLAADGTGTKYAPASLVAGSNITITTTTPGQITIASTATGGSGNSAFTIGSGKIYNATSTDLVGIGTITPVTTLYVQGKGGTNPFTIASSSGANLIVVNQAGNLSIPSLTVTGASASLNGAAYSWPASLPASPKILQSDASGNLTWVTDQTGGGGSLSGGLNGFVTVWTGTSTVSTGILMDNGTVAGVRATSSSYTFNIQGTGTTDIFNVASSSGTSDFVVTSSGNVGIGTATPAALFQVNGGDARFGDFANTARSVFMIRNNAAVGGFSSTNNIFSLFGGSTAASHLIINSSGNVGIGTTTPTARLGVSGTGAIDPFLISSSSGASLFKVDLLGNVNVATLTASSLVVTDANKNLASSNLTISNIVTTLATGTSGSIFNGSLANNTLTLNMPIASGSNTGQLSSTDWTTFNNKQNALSGGVIGSNAIWTSSSALGVGKLIDNGTVIGMNATSSTIGFNIQGTAGTNDIFNVSSSSGTSILRVTSAGNVGIGTSTPAVAFVLQNAAGTNDAFRIASSSGATLALFDSQGHLQIGTTTSTSNLSVIGAAGQTQNLMTIASSSGSTGFQVASGGTYGAIPQASTTISSATFTIDMSKVQKQEYVLATSTTLTFTNIQPGTTYTFGFIQDATGSRTITWPSAAHWPNATGPTLTTTANKEDVVTFWCTSTTVCKGGYGLYNYAP